MELLEKLEKTVLGWLKGVPNLPVSVRKWLGENVWWFAAAGAVLVGISVLGLLFMIVGFVTTLGNPYASFYASETFVMWNIITSSVAAFFAAVSVAFLAFAVTPLREKQKKGWVLLFAVWLVGAVATVVSAILTLNPFDVIVRIIFGALWLAISGYFLFEIHGQFAHVERSKGVKSKKKL